MRFKSILVTGTDTGVGKTTVASGIAAALSALGWRVGVCKPVETGCVADAGGEPFPADAGRLKFFSQSVAALKTVCPYALKDPLAPMLAAEREGVSIDVNRLLRAHQEVACAHDITLVEGAGGLLVPLTAAISFADLARRLDLGLLVVVGSRLGAINHTLLTIRYAQSLGLRVLGYVVNFLAATPDLAAQSNVDALTALIGPPVGVMTYLGEIAETGAGRRRLSEAASSSLRLDQLLIPC